MRFETILKNKRADRIPSFKKYIRDVHTWYHLMVIEEALKKEKGMNEVVVDIDTTRVMIRATFRNWLKTFEMDWRCWNNEQRLHFISNFLDNIYNKGF